MKELNAKCQFSFSVLWCLQESDNLAYQTLMFHLYNLLVFALAESGWPQ